MRTKRTVPLRSRERIEKLRIRIDLKIIIFLIIFYFTNQLRIYLIIMFFCILHEIGHLIAGLILKMKPEKIEIMPFGLSISFYTNFNDNKIKEIFVALAGPATSLASAILCNNINFGYITMQEAVYSNLLILLFNLIPLYPLDGGRIIKGILDIKLGVTKGSKIINKISYITMIILTVISSIGVFYYKNFAIFLFCIFLWIIVLKEKNGKSLDILQGK